MDKDTLSNYCYMQKELEYVRREIQSINAQLLNMELDSDVAHLGKKGKRTLGKAKTSGTRDKEYSRKKTKMQQLMLMYQKLDDELYEKVLEVEEYLESIEDIRIRQIMRLRYLGAKHGRRMTWDQIAAKMGETKDSCRKAHDRYLMQENKQ